MDITTNFNQSEMQKNLVARNDRLIEELIILKNTKNEALSQIQQLKMEIRVRNKIKNNSNSKQNTEKYVASLKSHSKKNSLKSVSKSRSRSKNDRISQNSHNSLDQNSIKSPKISIKNIQTHKNTHSSPLLNSKQKSPLRSNNSSIKNQHHSPSPSNQRNRYAEENKSSQRESRDSLKQKLRSLSRSRSYSNSPAPAKPPLKKAQAPSNTKVELLKNEIEDLKEKIQNIEGTLARSNVNVANLSSIQPIDSNYFQSIPNVNTVNFQNSHLQKLNNFDNSTIRDSVATNNSYITNPLYNNVKIALNNTHDKKTKKSTSQKNQVYEALDNFEKTQKCFVSKIQLDNIRAGYREAFKTAQRSAKIITTGQEQNYQIERMNKLKDDKLRVLRG